MLQTDPTTVTWSIGTVYSAVGSVYSAVTCDDSGFTGFVAASNGTTAASSVVVVITGPGSGSPLSLALNTPMSEGTLPASIQRRFPFRTLSCRSSDPSPIH